jgi:hypothetical protein
MNFPMNLGVKPLGRQADGPSPVVAAELAAFAAFKADWFAALALPLNDRAKALRGVQLAHASPNARAEREAAFRELGLDW